jgi:hypothetical protein
MALSVGCCSCLYDRILDGALIAAFFMSVRGAVRLLIAR